MNNTSLWKRLTYMVIASSICSYAVELEKMIIRAQTRDPSIIAQNALISYQKAVASSESRWGNTDVELGTVNLGTREWDLTASQSLELGDRVLRRSAIAHAEARVLEAETQVRRAEIALAVNQMFHKIMLSDRSMELLDSQVVETRSLLDWQRKMTLSGSLDPLDTLRTGVVLEEISLELAEWRTQRSGAKASLELLLDTTFSENETFAGAWPNPGSKDASTISRENPRLQVTAATLEIADAELEVQKLAGKPDLTITTGITGGEGFGGILGVGVSLPLFTGNSNRLLASQEKRSAVLANIQASKKEELANIQRIKIELRSLASEYETVVNRLLPLERTVLDVSIQRYRQGSLPQSSLWTQMEAVTRLELRKIEINARYADAIVEITLFPESK